MSEKPSLLFVSTRFLFPVDSGGKIRTTQVLRGMKGGKYRIVLTSPATATDQTKFSSEIDEVCDEFRPWPEPERGSLFHFTRMRYLLNALPIPVRTDRHVDGVSLVQRLIDEEPDIAVFDFAHAGVLAPTRIQCPSVMFTHNVEAEIFKRHVDVAGNLFTRLIWRNQYRKMLEFEKRSLQKFDVVVAVADRDSVQFEKDYSIDQPHVIPTGVDLEFFEYRAPTRNRDVVFCGSMDWMANQEGIRYFMDEVWADVVKVVPDANMTVVGRAAPDGLVQEAKRRDLRWKFTGFVDDVRSYVQGSAVSVIPLRVGGGTRLKAYEAMAMGSPIVSTSIGMEGLPVVPGKHFVQADDSPNFANAIVELLKDDQRRVTMARESREFVEQNFSYEVAARSFEVACEKAVSRHTEQSGLI